MSGQKWNITSKMREGKQATWLNEGKNTTVIEIVNCMERELDLEV
jgi:hypothetical protein